MALPDFTLQDATTYKTNIDATAQDHETKLAERVPNDGVYLDPTDGSIVLGSYKQGAIGYTLIDAGAPNYPKNNGVVYTFNGEHLSRCYSIFDASKESGNSTPFLYIQTYDNDGTPSGWHEFSFQDTTGGGSNVINQNSPNSANDARSLFTLCNADTPNDGLFYLVNTYDEDGAGNILYQWATGYNSQSKGVYSRLSTDGGANWNSWQEIAVGPNRVGGGSNVIENQNLGSANDLRVLHGFANADCPTSGTYIVKTFVSGSNDAIYQQAFGYNGTTGVWERDSVDNGTTWEPWVEISTAPLESIAITTTKTDAVLSGGAETTKNGTVVFINVNVECETLTHDETIFSIDQTHAPAVDIWLPILTRNAGDSNNHIGGTIKLGADGNGIYLGPPVSASALYFGINGLQWKFA